MPTLTLNVNGRDCKLDVDLDTPLLYVLRNHLGLTGAKLGCGLEQCGACAVLVDGQSTLSCVAPVAGFQGKAIHTIESLAESGKLNPVQQALVNESAAQCGYCIPGIVVALTALWYRTNNATDEDIGLALQPHLCRCGSHSRILSAAKACFTKQPGA
ncbi:MAG: (2Fe-2S)-binding protein [Gammaproteobacteria bacterium]